MSKPITVLRFVGLRRQSWWAYDIRVSIRAQVAPARVPISRSVDRVVSTIPVARGGLRALFAQDHEFVDEV